jgi:uncharacterized protein (TIGR03435 family)
MSQERPVMMNLHQRFYAAIIRLHPAPFRTEFGREMARDYEDALHTHGLRTLGRDALLSLAGQWTAHILSTAPDPISTPKASLLAGDYIMIHDKPFTPLELTRGLIATVTLLALCAAALSANFNHPPNIKVVFAASRNPPATNIHAQILHASEPLPSFEVISIRPYNLQPAPPPPPPPPADGAAGTRPALPARFAPGRGGAQTSDRVRLIVTTQELIASAFNVTFGFEGRIEGGPDWVRQGSDRYEIQAKIDDATFAALQKLPPSQQRDQVDLMEQSLLADRFHLKLHSETRLLPAYALVVAKGGPKLIPAKDGEIRRISIQDNTMTATAITLDQWVLAPFLGGRTILNQTGLSDSYDITLTWSELATQDLSFVSDKPSLFSAIQQQLGLKLVPTKAPVEILVIDHIEHPSEN